VNDRYLYDYDRIVNRLGAYVEMAAQAGALEQVIVRTMRGGKSGVGGSSHDQDRAIEQLERGFGRLFKFEFGNAEHDRYVLLERADRSSARILIGRGLDFIGADGRVLPTYVVIEDPLK
jgi:hypothetical protein